MLGIGIVEYFFIQTANYGKLCIPYFGNSMRLRFASS